MQHILAMDFAGCVTRVTRYRDKIEDGSKERNQWARPTVERNEQGARRGQASPSS